MQRESASISLAKIGVVIQHTSCRARYSKNLYYPAFRAMGHEPIQMHRSCGLMRLPFQAPVLFRAQKEKTAGERQPFPWLGTHPFVHRACGVRIFKLHFCFRRSRQLHAKKTALGGRRPFSCGDIWGAFLDSGFNLATPGGVDFAKYFLHDFVNKSRRDSSFPKTKNNSNFKYGLQEMSRKVQKYLSLVLF